MYDTAVFFSLSIFLSLFLPVIRSFVRSYSQTDRKTANAELVSCKKKKEKRKKRKRHGAQSPVTSPQSPSSLPPYSARTNKTGNEIYKNKRKGKVKGLPRFFQQTRKRRLGR